MARNDYYNQNDVFVSHNRKQKDWVRTFVVHLRSMGASVFFDEDSIPPGADIVRAIEDAIESSRHLVLAISPSSLASDWVALETVITINNDLSAGQQKLIPVIIEPTSVNDIRPAVRRLNIIDLSNPELRRERYRRLIQYLCPSAKNIPDFECWLEDELNLATAPPLRPCIVHELPPAPFFVGREKELKRLGEICRRHGSVVVSIEGIGGSGKTALVQAFLDSVCHESIQPDAIFVWSFYEDPDPISFLKQAHEYLTGESRSEITGLAWLHLLKAVVSKGPRYFFILDGLEKIQRVERFNPGDRHVYGQLEDAPLRDFLRRIASGAGNSKAIITTRFPVVDLYNWKNKGYECLDLTELDSDSAVHLLHCHEIKGDRSVLRALVSTYGSHALTLDHLGSLLSTYFQGRPECAPKLGKLDDFQYNPQSRKLASIFRAYESCLPSLQLEILKRLCIFRFSVSFELFENVFVNSQKPDMSGVQLSDTTPSHAREAMNTLVQQHLVLKDSEERYTIHPAVRDHFYSLFSKVNEVHGNVSEYYYATLTDRPGTTLPSDKENLDILEELINHLISSGDVSRAEKIYKERLGGAWHLTACGEFARGKRILSQFPRVIDADGWFRYRRALGDIPTVQEWDQLAHQLTYFSSSGRDIILLLTGRLRQCSSGAAKFLRGESICPNWSNDFTPRFPALVLYYKDPKDFLNTYRSGPTRYVWYTDSKGRRFNSTSEIVKTFTPPPELAKKLGKIPDNYWQLESAGGKLILDHYG